MEFTTTAIPKVPQTNSQRSRKYNLKNVQKISDYKKKYDESDYLSRPFIAWDGEGVTNPKTNEHHFVMWANSLGHDIGVKNKGDNYSGLSTVDLLTFICEEGAANPKAIHIIFSGGYDFNMICKDIPKEEMWEIYTRQYWEWNGFKISWRRGKYFSVRDLTVRDSKTVTIFDIWPFFQGSFVAACDSYLKDQFIGREEIVMNKADRGSFKNEDYTLIRHYNNLELINLVHLAEELRRNLNAVNIRLSRWDGPGAIAAKLLTANGIKTAMGKDNIPPEVELAGEFAYTAGRFELVKYGNTKKKTYEYDLNSAYPWGLTFVPNLTNGHWVHYDKKQCEKLRITNRFQFAMYFVEFDDIFTCLVDRHQPRPFFKRDKNGNLSYAEYCEGWYWASEVYNGIEYTKRWIGSKVIIKEAWVFVENNKNDRPFAFINELYDLRQEYKACGNGAEKAIKLGLNSMYGKLAQQVGWRYGSFGEIEPPPFHQLLWAGFITALCRATVFYAAIDDLDCVIAYETDALFTTKLLDIEVGPGLGNWEYTEFSELTYMQSGFYSANHTVQDYEEAVEKRRGINKGIISTTDMHEAMRNYGKLNAESTQFIGIGTALYQNWKSWCTWITSPRIIDLTDKNSKRFHDPNYCRVCEASKDKKHMKMNVWHDTMIRCNSIYGLNARFVIDWKQDQATKAERRMKKKFAISREQNKEQDLLF